MEGTLTLPFVIKPTWVNANENSLALHHYKRPIPYLIKAGSSVTINTDHECVVLVLNNNRNTETITELVFNENTIIIDELVVDITVDSVVFLNCLLVDNSNGEFSVAYTINGEYEPLVHIICNENSEYTDGVDDELSYVLIEGETVQILVPRVDLPYLNEMIELDNQLSDFNNFYKDIVDVYNDMAGIVFRRKYFAKADIGGPGEAYYGKWFMGSSWSTLRNNYLRLGPTNWTPLHEMAHSYDTHFIRNRDQVSIVEVWTNIFGDYYQYLRMSPQEYNDRGWMFNLGRRVTVMTELIEAFYNRPIQDWNLRQKLIYLTAFFYKVGHTNLMRNMFSYMINLIETGTFDVNTFRVIDIIIEQCNNFNVDVVHVNQMCGVELLSKNIIQTVKYNFANSVLVYEFLLKPATLSFALTSSNHDIQTDAMLTFAQPHANDMLGGQYSLVQNASNQYMFTFTRDKTQHVSGMQGGCYKFFYNSGNSTRRYRTETDYVFFDGKSDISAPIFEPYTHSLLLNEHFTFRGIGDWRCHTLDLDFNNMQYLFRTFISRPHYGVNHRDKVYYSIDIEGVTFIQILGDNNPARPPLETYPLYIGQHLSIYHAEHSNRLITDFFTTDYLTHFIITEQGVQLVKDMDASVLINRLVNYCNMISQNYPTIQQSPSVSNTVLLAYWVLSQKEQSQLSDIVAPYLIDTSVTSFTILGQQNQNIIHLYESEGMMQIDIFDNSTPQNNVNVDLVRYDEIVFSIVINGSTPLFASRQYVQIKNYDVLVLRASDIENKRFIVIDGVLQNPSPSKSVYFEFIDNTFKETPSITPEEPPQNIQPWPILILVGVLFLITIMLLILLSVCNGKLQNAQPARVLQTGIQQPLMSPIQPPPLPPLMSPILPPQPSPLPRPTIIQRPLTPLPPTIINV
jgi:hypothetical protein